MNLINIVKNMRNITNYVDICKKEKDILKQCVLCKYYLSSNQWSMVLESSIKQRFNILQAKDNMSGDGLINNKTVEIKVSLGGSNGQFNFVQLRPSHTIDYYLFLVYDVYSSHSNLGQIHWFLSKPNDLYKLLPEYGGYAHGTVSNNGKITEENIFKKGNEKLEYSLRPNNLKNGKSKELWDILIDKFSINENDILLELNKK